MTRAWRIGAWGALALVMLVALPGAWPGAAAEETTPAEVEALPAAGGEAGTRDGVSVRVTQGASGLEVEGRCFVAAPVAIAWEVLTDYDGIDGFVSSMRESRVAGRGEHHVLVEQVAVGRLLLFRRRFHATLFVEETPRTRIRFEDVLGRDFESYRGEWRIEERPEGVELVYAVGARPSFSIPGFVARGVFQRTARELLSQVKVEIERRARGS